MIVISTESVGNDDQSAAEENILYAQLKMNNDKKR